MAFRANYWSCSDFMGWFWEKAKHPKPHCASLKEWKEWEVIAKEKYKALLLMEKLLDGIQNTIHWPSDVLHSFLWSLKNFQRKSAYIETPTSSLTGYSDFRYKIEAGLFYEFEKFVDLECAWMNTMKKRSIGQRIKLAFTSPKIDPFKVSRDGISYLQFQKDCLLEHFNEYKAEGNEISPEHLESVMKQSLAYTRLIDLYLWIKQVYNPRMHDPKYYDYDNDKVWQEELDKRLATLVKYRLFLWT